MSAHGTQRTNSNVAVMSEGKEPPRLDCYTQRDDGTTPDVFEVSGSVKWFDSSKGYGFIVPDEDLPDVLLHVTCLRHGGLQTAYEGARVVCEVVRSPKGLQAVRISSMDDSTAIHPSQLPQRTRVVVVAESGWERAVVKWLNRLRGFGFLTRGSQTPDIFVHMETLRRCGFTELRPGQTVLVRYGRDQMVSSRRNLSPTTLRVPPLTDNLGARPFSGYAPFRYASRKSPEKAPVA